MEILKEKLTLVEPSTMIPSPQEFNKIEYKNVLKQIHTKDVAATISSYKMNRVLGS